MRDTMLSDEKRRELTHRVYAVYSACCYHHRYNRTLNSTERDAVAQARDSLKAVGLPLDNGTYTATIVQAAHELLPIAQQVVAFAEAQQARAN